MKATSEQMPMCCNCKHGKRIPLTDEVICPFHGAVISSYSCKKYCYDLFLKKSKRRRGIDTNEFSHEDFSISDAN